MTLNDLEDRLYVIDITDPLVLIKSRLSANNIVMLKETYDKIIKNAVIQMVSSLLGGFVSNYEPSLTLDDFDNVKELYEAYKDLEHTIINVLYINLKISYRREYYIGILPVNSKLYVSLTSKK